ncbi:hypothetical protein ACHAXT_005430 [Thalassiosira profunda]
MAKSKFPALLALASVPLFAEGFAFQPAAPLRAPSPTALASTAAEWVAEAPTGSGAFWKWRGQDIFADVRTPAAADANGKTAILLHGFGASTVYWRETMAVLEGEGYNVHALDLLGQGRSSKPYTEEEDANVEYSINLWGEMVDDYARHHELENVVLMGNSIGSLVALSAATGDFIESTADRENVFAYLAGNNKGEQSRVKGLCLFNCGVGLNSRNVVKNPEFNELQRTVFNGLFDVLNGIIFGNKPLLRYAINNVVTKELLEDALKNLYIVSPERVDTELVDSFYYPAKNGDVEGVVESIKQIYCNDAGKTPKEYHETYPEILDSLPLHLIWGLEDAVTPIQGDVGQFYCDRVANNRGGKGMTSLDTLSSGHMPFDDNPEETHESMLRWLNKRIVK